MAISITVDTATGNITVAPTVANFHPGDQVVWEANATSLTITFKDQSPFDRMQLSGTSSVGEQIPLSSPKGVRYHYSVAAMVNGTIYVIPGCPEIVVQ